MSMRPYTAIEMSAQAAESWRAQYKDWADEDKFFDGTAKGQVNDSLNNNQHTPENIAKIINSSWSHPLCDSCGERYNVVVKIQRWNDDCYSICQRCVERAATILLGFADARQEAPK